MTGQIKPGKEIWYPGFKGGGRRVICNLSSYSSEEQNPRIRFDIERLVQWDRNLKLLPFTYSFMINSHQEKPQDYKEIEKMKAEFMKQVSQMSGFQFEKQRDNFVDYVNPQHHNILVDWINSSDSWITIGVIQERKLPELNQVIQSLPYAVNIFNTLSPYKLEQEVVEESISIARKSNLLIPRCRLRERKAYEQYLDRKHNQHS